MNAERVTKLIVLVCKMIERRSEGNSPEVRLAKRVLAEIADSQR